MSKDALTKAALYAVILNQLYYMLRTWHEIQYRIVKMCNILEDILSRLKYVFGIIQNRRVHGAISARSCEVPQNKF